MTLASTARLEHVGRVRGRGQPGGDAAILLHCRWPWPWNAFLRDSHRILTIIAVISRQNDGVCVSPAGGYM